VCLLSLGLAPVLFAQSVEFDAKKQVPADKPAEGTVARVTHSETVSLSD